MPHTGDLEILKSDTKGRVYTRPEQREQILQEFEQSGLSSARFADLHGIKYSTFMAWRRWQRQRSESEPASSLMADLGLREVVIENSAPPPAPLQVQIPGGICLEITNPEQAQLAAHFVAQLQSASSSC